MCSLTSMNRILKISGIVGVISVFLLVVGTVTPGWMIFVDANTAVGYGNSYDTISMGLFYFSIWDQRVLKLYAYNDIPESLVISYQVLTDIKPRECQYLDLTGTLACLIGTVLIYTTNEKRDKLYILLPTVMYLITAITVWSAFGIWLKNILDVLAFTYMGIPYSLVFICLGASLAMFNMIPLIIVYTRNNRKYGQMETDYLLPSKRLLGRT